jgi:GxxExxY protein
LKHKDITGFILGCAFNVHNELGSGFLEKVYKSSLIIELNKSGFKAESEVPIKVKYYDKVVGEYIADIIVNKCVIVEIKAIKELAQVHEVQLVNYLKATGIEVGLLINFGKSVEFKRKVLELKT